MYAMKTAISHRRPSVICRDIFHDHSQVCINKTNLVKFCRPV